LRAADLLVRARRSVVSAKLLFDDGDLSGASNRAYYAMFDAARAALLAGSAPVKAETIKTHSGLIAAFSLHLIKTGLIPAQYGKSLRQADQVRLAADYSDAEVDRDLATTVIDKAHDFVEVIAGYLSDLA
jgi:uncharacterized protein (UPF0332 family)